MTTRPEFTDDAIPSLPQGVELRFDPAANAWTVSVPARVVTPDDIAIEVLKRCDGRTSIKAIVDELAQAFSASPDQVTADVEAMLADLMEQGMIEVAAEF
ncbi:MAG: pyrroloquinoline quinone biosynthesis peptide chaperone PqqD [Geminicoccaceae bacterium]